MADSDRAARITAAIVGLVALAGLAIQLAASTAMAGQVSTALWAMVRYFTILTNLAVAIIFVAVALGAAWARRSALLGGVTLAIILVGIVYGLLLRGLIELSGGARLADLLLHTIVPILVPLWWITAAPKGNLRWRDPPIWSVFPLAYLFYALLRGEADGIYAYPFINPVTLGWMRVLVNALGIAIGFLVAGAAMVALDHWLGRRAPAVV